MSAINVAPAPVEPEDHAEDCSGHSCDRLARLFESPPECTVKPAPPWCWTCGGEPTHAVGRTDPDGVFRARKRFCDPCLRVYQRAHLMIERL